VFDDNECFLHNWKSSYTQKICPGCEDDNKAIFNLKIDYKQQTKEIASLLAENERLRESLAYCFPRTSHGIDHGCSDCVGITEYSDGVFVCPYHKAKRALEGEKS